MILAKNSCVACEITMWSIRCTLALAALVLVLSVANVPFCALAVDETDARSSIEAAEENIVVCYRAVSDADEAGANTTALLAVLNEAGELLSRADLAYKMGDFDSALDFANQSQERLNGFVAQAVVLRETAVQQRYWDFMVYVVGSIVGTVVVVVGGFAVWFFFEEKV